MFSSPVKSSGSSNPVLRAFARRLIWCKVSGEWLCCILTFPVFSKEMDFCCRSSSKFSGTLLIYKTFILCDIQYWCVKMSKILNVHLYHVFHRIIVLKINMMPKKCSIFHCSPLVYLCCHFCLKFGS